MALLLILSREAFSGQRVNFWLETGDGCKSLVGKGPKFGLLGALLRTALQPGTIAVLLLVFFTLCVLTRSLCLSFSHISWYTSCKRYTMWTKVYGHWHYTICDCWTYFSASTLLGRFFYKILEPGCRHLLPLFYKCISEVRLWCWTMSSWIRCAPQQCRNI